MSSSMFGPLEKNRRTIECSYFESHLRKSLMNKLHRILSNFWLVLFVGSMFFVIFPAVAASPGLRITIGTFSPHFSPNFANIKTGTTISWENPTTQLHSITHDACTTGHRCAFDSGPIGPNQTFSINDLPPGSYPYHCSFHPNMRGILVVRESDVASET